MSIRDRAAGVLRKGLIAAVARDAINANAEGYATSVDESLMEGLTALRSSPVEWR